MADKEAGGGDTGPRGECRAQVLRLRRGGPERDEARSAQRPAAPSRTAGKWAPPPHPVQSLGPESAPRRGRGSRGPRAARWSRAPLRLGCGHCGGDRNPLPGTLSIRAAGWRLLRGPVRVPARTDPRVHPLRAVPGPPRLPGKGLTVGWPRHPQGLVSLTQRGGGWELGGKSKILTCPPPVPRRDRAYAPGVGSAAPVRAASRFLPRPSPGIPGAEQGRSVGDSTVPSFPRRGWGGRQRPVHSSGTPILQMFRAAFFGERG